MKQPHPLRDALVQVATTLAEDGRPTYQEVADRFKEDYPQVWSDYSDATSNQGLQRIIKDVYRSLFDQTVRKIGQLSFPGFSLPPYLFINDKNGKAYIVRTLNATDAELTIALNEREQNVEHAKVKLEEFKESYDQIHPLIKGTKQTVGWAIRKLFGGPSKP